MEIAGDIGGGVVAVVEPEIGYHKAWWRSMAALEGAESKRVAKAVAQFVTDPSHPSLNLHPIKGDPSGRLHSFRASDDLRVLVVKQGNVHVLVEVDHHDAIYERAARKRFVANVHTGFVGLIDLDRERHGIRPERQQRASIVHENRPGVVDHWGDADLREAGLTDGEIQLVRARNEDELLDLDLDEETLSLIIDLSEVTPEQWKAPALDPTVEAEARIRRAIVEFGAVSGISPLFPPDVVAELAAAPIEEWMVFLHPDQRAIVDRRVEGPARVRGSAGTGKTVVALHRAAALAARNRDRDRRPILFTTYIRSLPPVFAALYLRLPGTRAGEVDFVNIDKLAFAVCREMGERPVVVPKKVDAAYSAAHAAVVTPGSALVRAGLTRAYLREEVTAVIKGRGLLTLDEYLDVDRVGRRTRLTAPLRREVWNLHEEWARRMAADGTVDFPDVILRARDLARRRHAVRYAAAIIDEAQDLTLVGLQLARALVNGPAPHDVPDGLFIVGDGAQRIYPGGFTLRQAGVEVRGRTAVLRKNYRNTREIIDAALAISGDEVVDDLGDRMTRDEGAAGTETERTGVKPALVIAASFDDQMRFVAQQIERLVASRAIGTGDIAVAVDTNDKAARIERFLGRVRVPAQRLADYEGTPTERIKVGTHFRIKGLEFKVVFLPGLGAGEFPRAQAKAQDSAEYDEQRARAVSQLYVAMTRARDGLFLLATREPSPVLAPATGRFEVLET